MDEWLAPYVSQKEGFELVCTLVSQEEEFELLRIVVILREIAVCELVLPVSVCVGDFLPGPNLSLMVSLYLQEQHSPEL